KNLAPRIGFRWAPFARTDTVLQAGAGIYYDQIIAYSAAARKATAPFYQLIINPNFDSRSTFPDAVAGASLPGLFPPRVVHMDYLNTQTPRVYRYHVSIQQPLPGRWEIQASYVGARGNHLYRRYEGNLFPM